VLILVTERPLDETLARTHVAKGGNGAIVLFHGTVRDRHQGRDVSKIEYHAYGAMAEREMGAIARAAGGRHGVADVAVMHRLGRLEVGETSLIVAAAAPHRAEAFRCAEEIIDQIKARVPIWKKEIGPAGEMWQEGAAPPAP
jgi:molybdopterin synthase catalytic subunit